MKYINYILYGLIAFFLIFTILHKRKKGQKIIRDQQQDPEFVFDLGEKRLPTQMQGLRQPAPTQEQMNSGVTLMAVTAVPTEQGALDRLMETPAEDLGLPVPPPPFKKKETKQTVVALPSLKERAPVHTEEQTSAPPPIAPPTPEPSTSSERRTQFMASPPPQTRKPVKPT